MKVTKTALLGAIDKALADHARESAEYAAATEVWRKQQKQVWVDRKLPQWLALRDLIGRAKRSGKPLTADEVKGCFPGRDSYRSSYISDHTFSAEANPPDVIKLDGNVKVGKPTSIPRHDLEALKAFLVASPEEEFSMEALARLGFKAPSWVFRAAVVNAGLS